MDLEYTNTESTNYPETFNNITTTKKKIKIPILFEPEYIFKEIYDTFLNFKLLSDTYKCIFFGPIVTEIYSYEKGNNELYRADLFQDLHHTIHYFYIYMDDNLSVDKLISDFNNLKAGSNISVLEKCKFKRQNYNINITKIHIDYVDAEWYAYIYQIKYEQENSLKNYNIEVELSKLNECMGNLYKLSMFSKTNIIYFNKSFYSYDLFLKNEQDSIQKIQFEFISFEYYNISKGELYYKEMYKNLFFMIFELIYKKSIIKQNFNLNSDCLICCRNDINSEEIYHLHCCNQYMCFDCLINMLLNCQLYYEKKVVCLSCPFCRGNLAYNWDSCSL